MKTILVVEDDVRVSKAFGIRLRSLGFAVQTAHDAVTAVAAARKYRPDAILLDIFMPGGDGFVVAERLHKLAETARTPIIFATASKEDGLRDRAKQLGAVRFLEKPFSASSLVEAIQAAFDPAEFWDVNMRGEEAWT